MVLIQHALNGGEYKIHNSMYKADGYCKETNTIYEFQEITMEIQVTSSDEMNTLCGKTMGELYQILSKKKNSLFLKDII